MTSKAHDLAESERSPLTHRQYLALAAPLIVSGLSTPILGAVDTAVVGRMADPSYIGGVAVGSLIFNTMYWLLGFLRVSTTGFTAQAHGAGNQTETALVFFRPLFIAFVCGLVFIVLQYPILQAALSLINAGEGVTGHATAYFSIRIWGAPFTLMCYVVVGWLMGMGEVKWSLAAQIFMNVLNIVLDLVFVLGLGLGVKGVAYATLISEICAVLFGGAIIFHGKRLSLAALKTNMLLEAASLKRMLIVNRDLFFRTVCLLTMTGIFTAVGAMFGEVTLAANAVLFQIQYIMAYFFGGLANASSIVIGRAIGGNNHRLFRRAFTLSAQWGFAAAVILALCIFFFGKQFISLFTDIDEVKVVAEQFAIWMMIFPFAGFWGLQLEGVFSGATEARGIRNSMFLALLVFLPAVWLLVPAYGNHGIWLSFILFSFSRSLFLSLFIPKLARSRLTFTNHLTIIIKIN
ncbi:multidrug resistance protein, MATE family [Evansella caseinilytica]|uniref:Probable multidrug resistance protein NorM n=1 Tax=Evansella caseinilytica TaxID=1503961 RepID=A0A1H3SYU0_9BACI|nr:MATE family efflux transporter [Evansella caseinilytica]SDZ42857.1 multidrug resistance protein, MATE family [Evansella caseinilytica]